MGLREKILAVEDSKTDTVTVPEWGLEIPIRSLTAMELERWWDIVNDHANKGVDPAGGRQAALIFMGTCDEAGRPLFKPEDLEALGNKSPIAIERIFNAIRRVSGMDAKAEADIEKKPDETTSSSSSG